MNHNQLTELRAGDFEGLPRVTSLSLDYNKITHIDNEAFRGLEGETESPLIVVIVTSDLVRSIVQRVMELRRNVLTRIVMFWLDISWNILRVFVGIFRAIFNGVPNATKLSLEK